MLKITNLEKNYTNTKVFQGFNLEVNQGETIAIMGQSGSGKSTLLNIIAGIDTKNGGEMIFEGENITQFKETQWSDFRAKNLGFVYQFHHLLQDFTALENVCMPLFIANIRKTQAIQLATIMLEKVGLKDKLHHHPNQLSGGQRQRVAIARALVNSPKLILADEPTGNLDKDNAIKIMDLLLELQQENNCSLIIATHDENLAKKTDKIITI